MDLSTYQYEDADFNHSHDYLLPALVNILARYNPHKVIEMFELGCGNGSTANFLWQKGFSIVGIDPSAEGIKQANLHFPHIRLELGASGESLSAKFGVFRILYSLEVIEHVYDPWDFINDVNSLLCPDGVAILSTPYHSYLKNLVISIFGLWDKHFTVLWRGGHIKFWSPKSISHLLERNGFEILDIVRVGRVPILAKSMIVVARKL